MAGSTTTFEMSDQATRCSWARVRLSETLTRTVQDRCDRPPRWRFVKVWAYAFLGTGTGVWVDFACDEHAQIDLELGDHDEPSANGYVVLARTRL